MKLAANISWLFKGKTSCCQFKTTFQEEENLLKRLALAKKAGFSYFEVAWPYEHSVEERVFTDIFWKSDILN
jgi:hydroxypyruvate isomerase